MPPTKGLYKGESKGELAVQVIVLQADKPTNAEVELVFPSQDDVWTETPRDEKRDEKARSAVLATRLGSGLALSRERSH